MSNASCPPARACTRSRRGRLLVECLVAMLLLNASALVVVALARGAAASTRSAHDTSAAWSLAVHGVEAAVASPCQAGNADGTDALPLIEVSWNEQTIGRWRKREIQAELTGSALAGTHTTRMTWSAARYCP